MNDPRRPGRFYPTGQRNEPTEHLGYRFPQSTDPAYGGRPPYPPPYGPPRAVPGSPRPTESNPTEQLPTYWRQGGSPPDEPSQGTSSRQRFKSPPWLWIAAAAAVLLVVAMVIALVIANSRAKKPTTVPPLTAMPGSSSKTPTSTTGSPGTTAPTQTGGAGAMQTVVYNVTGQGHAISITYTDTGDVKQTEFNVALPWSKEVSLSSARDKASVTIINVGHDVTCSVTVAGVQVHQHTGVGLTTCRAAG